MTIRRPQGGSNGSTYPFTEKLKLIICRAFEREYRGNIEPRPRRRETDTFRSCDAAQHSAQTKHKLFWRTHISGQNNRCETDKGLFGNRTFVGNRSKPIKIFFWSLYFFMQNTTVPKAIRTFLLFLVPPDKIAVRGPNNLASCSKTFQFTVLCRYIIVVSATHLSPTH